MAMAVSCSLVSASRVFVPAPAYRPTSRPAAPLAIECSSRPQKKATAHHVKTRPKKHNPYDKNRKGPTYYPRLPKPPPIWGLDTTPQVEEQAELQPVADTPAS